MVGHQHIGMQAYGVARQAILQQLQVEEVILFGKKTGFTIVAALHDMKRQAGGIHPWSSWHGGSFRTVKLGSQFI